DFGIAALKQRPCPPEIGEDLRTEPISSGARICGTIPYMSPEQIQGDEADPRSDIFSLGIVLYEMAAGERPFRGKTVADVMAAILKDEPEPVTARKPALPRQLDRILRHCLEKDLRQRLQVSLDLRNELESLRNELGADHPIQGASIAVLPFEDMSPDRDQGYFCSGIAEEILIALSGIRDLRVVSRTSSFPFGGSGLGSREIGRRLGVATLLEGSVRKAGNRVRVTAELIDVTTGYTLWSRRYDRELQDVFEIQDEIARRISSRMRITLSPEERSALGRAPTTKVQAYDYYLRGRGFYFQYRRRGIQFGLEMFRRAIAIDPHYARAHAGVADCCAWLYMYGGSSEENRVEADRASRRALELDPELAEAHVSRGVALSLQGDYGAAERCFEEAIRLDPDLFEAHYFYARDCFAQGKAEKAIEMFGRAAAVRPDDCQSDALVAQILDELGRPEEARAARRKAVERATARLQLNPDDTRTLYLAANALVALGETERGLEWAGRALSSDPDEPMVVYNIACIHALAGHHEKALDLLEHAVNAGLTQRDWLLHDGDLRPLREHPRFQDIIAALDHLQAVRSNG
ncbi:MAG: tetratricopeptide repeat protein, partial [Acidobacteriota bacterium]